MDTNTPAVNAMPFMRTAPGLFLACSTRLMALIDNTGNTQGIRFRINPPRMADNASINSEASSTGADGTAGVLAVAGFAKRGAAAVAPAAAEIVSGAEMASGTRALPVPLFWVSTTTPSMGPFLGGA